MEVAACDRFFCFLLRDSAANLVFSPVNTFPGVFIRSKTVVMVLVELGNQITGALRKLNETTVIDQASFDDHIFV